MASLEMNKIAAGVLTAGLLAMGASKVAEVLVHPTPLEKSVVVIDTSALTVAASSGPAKPDVIEPILPLLHSADIAAGEKGVKACKACHTFTQGGAQKQGPNLWNIVNRKKGGVDGFGYSAAMKGFDGAPNWDYDSLNAFLKKPKTYMAGTKMNYKGISKVPKRAQVVAYLRSLSDSPAAFPTADAIAKAVADHEAAKKQ
jgi:cytochrome c